MIDPPLFVHSGFYSLDVFELDLNRSVPIISRTNIIPNACHVVRIGAADQNIGAIQFQRKATIHPSSIRSPAIRTIATRHPIAVQSRLKNSFIFVCFYCL